MYIYRYSQEETHTLTVHALTDWHTTEEGAKEQLFRDYPRFASGVDKMEDADLEKCILVQDVPLQEQPLSDGYDDPSICPVCGKYGDSCQCY